LVAPRRKRADHGSRQPRRPDRRVLPGARRRGLLDPLAYHHPETEADVVEEMRAFFDERPAQDSTHTVRRRLHAEAASVCEGRVSGALADGTPKDTTFCDVFEFDETGERLARVGVYLPAGAAVTMADPATRRPSRS
jgi:hypothetical protein